jgi:hypothetical protein
MRETLNYQDRSITLYCINLCSYGDSGDYELFPDEDMGILLIDQVKNLDNIGCSIVDVNESVGFLHLRGMEITLYPSGRMIIENVKPDDRLVAIETARNIFQALG